MAHLNVILADTDLNFENQLEIKLAFELDGIADLEIITDINYFNNYLKKPVKADVLIISESLFSEDLYNFNIGSIVLLTEQEETSNSKKFERLFRIYKYTSISAIYKQIIIACPKLNKNGDNKQTTLLMFSSASGGTGKSTLSLAVANALSKRYYKTLYINAQRTNVFELFMSSKSYISNEFISELINKSPSLDKRIMQTIVKDSIDYFPPFEMSLSSYGIDMGAYLYIIKSIKDTNKYDYIIVDSESIFDEYQAELMTCADKVVFVYNQDKISIGSLNIFLKNIVYKENDKYIFICNKFDITKKNNDIKQSFRMTESVSYIKNAEHLLPEDLSVQSDIKKIAYLFM